MNANIFRLVFSKRLGMLVPVSEQHPAHAKGSVGKASPRRAKTVIFPLNALVFGIAAVLSAPTVALPTTPTVASGSATFQQSGGSLTVTNTPNAIINWGGFSIGQNEITKFVQQSSASAVLNRVIGQDPSQILGQMQSNGRVFLINPNGILFGAGARIDTAGLISSTLNLSDADFLAGRMRFSGIGTEGKVENQGTINTANGGFVYLIAPNVENSGIINAPNGDVLLAAGQSVEIADGLNPALRVQITSPEGQVTNLGQILAEAGRIGLQGGIVSNAGTISASSAVAEGGKIYLRATNKIELTDTSKVGADGTAGVLKQGGEILLEAATVSLGGTVSADGAAGGGTIVVDANSANFAGLLSATGGSGQGGSIDIRSGTIALHNVHSTLDASGATGGSIREVAGQQITSSATYLATGVDGQGGQVDLSAPATKLLSAQIDASGATGGGQVRIGGEYQGGKNLIVDELPNAETLAISNGSVIRADATRQGSGGSVILWSDLESALYPAVSAKGKGGAGGFIELSSGDKLTWGGSADAGPGGQVLMDPKNIVIQDATAGSVQYNLVLGYNYLDLPRMKGKDLQGSDRFGWSVSLSGTQLAVGAPGDDGESEVASDSGAVYLFNTPFTSPSLAGVIGRGYTGTGNYNLSALGAGDNFGGAVSLSGNQLAVGAYSDDGAGNAVSNSGAVYLFNNPLTAPSLSGVIGYDYSGTGSYNLSTLQTVDGFGISVSLSGTQLAVGAHNDDGAGNAVSNSGAVYLFNTPFGTPSLAGVIGKGYTGAGNYNLSALEVDDLFGWSVSLSGTQLAVGARTDDGAGNAVSNSGAVYLFNTPFGTPSLSGVIGKGYTGAGNYDLGALEMDDLFGWSVSLSGTQLAVGAYADAGAGNAAGTNTGAVYLFNAPFSTPSLAGVIGKGYTGAGNYDLTALEAGDAFGRSVSLSDNQLAVGAPSDQGAGNVGYGGAVYLFNTPFGTPSLSGVIGQGYTGAGNYDLSALEAGDNFGASVSLSGSQLAVGAQYDGGAGNVAYQSGAVYLFTLNSGTGGDPTSGQTFSANAGSDASISPASIAAILNTGSSLTLQANNDITITSAISANNPGGNGGALTLQAGRSIAINADITTDNGNLNLSANDAIADSGYREAGAANIDVASGVTIDTGTGSFSATIGGLSTVGSFTNAGTISAGSGSSISATFDNTGIFNQNNGTLSLLQGGTNSGTFNLAGTGSISLANTGSGYPTFSNAASGILNINSTTGGWSFVSDSGTQGGIVNNAGTININTGYTSWEAAFTNTSTGLLNIAAGNALSMQNGQTLQGTIGLGAGSTLWVSEQHGTNAWFNGTTINGTGKVQVVGGVSPVADFTNVSASSATLLVGSGGTANILGTTTFANLNITGGTLGGTSTLNVTNSLTQSGGTQSGSGTTVLTSTASSTIGAQSLSRGLTNQGLLSLDSTSLSAAFANSGTLNLGGTVSMGGGMQQTGGAMTVPAGVTLGVGGSGLVLAGGMLTGNGSISGNVSNTGGTLAPGASPGTLTITGNYIQGSSGTLLMDLGGTSQGVNYDWLNVTGTATLGGTLQAVLYGGFTPSAGNLFNLINANGGISGTFATLNLPAGYTFSHTYGASLFSLSSPNIAPTTAPPATTSVPDTAVVDHSIYLGALSYETPLLYASGQSSTTASSSGTLTQTAESVLPALIPPATTSQFRGQSELSETAIALLPVFEQMVRDTRNEEPNYECRLNCRR